MITQEFAQQCFDYDAETGILTWRERPREHFRTVRGWKIFNNRTAGGVAGNINSSGYLWFRVTLLNDMRVTRTQYPIHRIVWLWATGALPKNQIDHIDGDRVNNRIDNLRDVTQDINQRNAKLRSTNTSGVSGVSWHKQHKKWGTHGCLNGKMKHLGYFDSKTEAQAAVKVFRRKLGGFTERHGQPITT